MDQSLKAWKACILIVSSIFPFLLMTWAPLATEEKLPAHTHLKISAIGSVTPASPDLTPTALENQNLSQQVTMTARENNKLSEEITQLQRANERTFSAWFWNNALTSLSTSILILAAFAGVWRWFLDRRKEQEKRSEDRFQAVVESLGGERTETKVGGAIMLRTFLEGGYKRFHRQVFDLAVANLRPSKPDDSDVSALLSPLRRALTPVQPDQNETPSSLSQALTTVFKTSLPLARAQLEKSKSAFRPQDLDATGIVLDNAYLAGADLNGVWMPEASLEKANLTHAYLNNTNLARTDLTGACLKVAELKNTNLRGAILTKADLTGAILTKADLTDACLDETNLTGADLSGSNPEDAKTLKGAIMRNVQGLSASQRRQCKEDKHAIVEDTED